MAKWTGEKTIRQILRREAAGLPLSPGGSREGVESKLQMAGSRVVYARDVRSGRPYE
ncbi:MAG TPA: hypothetical protein VMZ31_10600 [Phycisphaerae bacterium]|nr:hypothetical protein [Phycisphaerae bacterium]